MSYSDFSGVGFHLDNQVSEMVTWIMEKLPEVDPEERSDVFMALMKKNEKHIGEPSTYKGRPCSVIQALLRGEHYSLLIKAAEAGFVVSPDYELVYDGWPKMFLGREKALHHISMQLIRQLALEKVQKMKLRHRLDMKDMQLKNNADLFRRRLRKKEELCRKKLKEKEEELMAGLRICNTSLEFASGLTKVVDQLIKEKNSDSSDAEGESE